MIKCQNVLIKFMDKNVPQLEVRCLQVTGSHYILVSISPEHKFLSLMHKSETGYSLKQLNFNLNDVKEYVCESINDIPPVSCE